MEDKSLYLQGHLFVAAIRVLEHRHGAPPAMGQITELLGWSAEQSGRIGRRLHEAGIIAPLEKAYADRWIVGDHLRLEELPREVEETQLDSALKKFQSERGKITQKVESIKEERERKRRELFADIQSKLKKGLEKE